PPCRRDPPGSRPLPCTTLFRSRLSRSRWPVEDHGTQLVGLDGPSQEPPGTEDPVLADELIEGARPHAGSERFARVRLEQVRLWRLAVHDVPESLTRTRPVD